MKNFASVFAALMLALLFVGCATGPRYDSVKDTFPPLTADAGRIFIYRDAIYNPKKTPDILLNGEAIGKSEAAGFLYIDRPAGEYKIEIAGESSPPAIFTLSRGQTLYVRIGLHSNLVINRQYPEVVDDATGQREIVACKYVGGIQK